jgi:hypothetical protein
VLHAVERRERTSRLEPALAWQAHGAAITGLLMSGVHVISAGRDARLRWWTRATGERAYSSNTGSPVLCLTDDLPDGILAGTESGELISRHEATFERLPRGRSAGGGAVTAIAVETPAIAIASGLLVDRVDPSRRPPTAIRLDEPCEALGLGHGLLVLSGGTLRAYNYNAEPLELPAILAYTTITALARYGLVVGCLDGRVLDGDRTVGTHARAVRAVAKRVDGVVSTDGDEVIWWRAGRRLATGKHAGACAIASYGDVIATGSSDGSIRLWPPISG